MKYMKFLLKKDLKKTLPSFAMFVMAMIALCVMTAFGILTNNGNFTVTALYIFYIVLIMVCFYIIFQGANLLRKNLSDKDYMAKIEAEGFNRVRFVGGKILWTIIETEILYTVYVIGFVIMLLWADSRLKDISTELGSQKFVPNGEAILTVASGYFLVIGVTAFVYTGFLLCYRFFLKGKYALYGSLSTTFCVFFVVWKIFDWTVPRAGISSLIGTIIYCVIETAIFMLINLTICEKLILYKGE